MAGKAAARFAGAFQIQMLSDPDSHDAGHDRHNRGDPGRIRSAGSRFLIVLAGVLILLVTWGLFWAASLIAPMLGL